jgi:hypothetical protein
VKALLAVAPEGVAYKYSSPATSTCEVKLKYLLPVVEMSMPVAISVPAIVVPKSKVVAGVAVLTVT